MCFDLIVHVTIITFYGIIIEIKIKITGWLWTWKWNLEILNQPTTTYMPFSCKVKLQNSSKHSFIFSAQQPSTKIVNKVWTLHGSTQRIWGGLSPLQPPLTCARLGNSITKNSKNKAMIAIIVIITINNFFLLFLI